MAQFILEHNGKQYQVEAPDQETAVEAFADAMGIKPVETTATPPRGLVPGSPAYAKWAAEQARAGKKLPTVGEHTGASIPFDPMDAAFAASGSFIEGVPIAGPSLIDWAKQGRAAVQGMSPEEVNAEFAVSKETNPIASGAGTVAGAVAPLAALATLPVAGSLLGAAGGLPWQMGLGAASSGVIGGLDAKARGASDVDAVGAGLLSSGIGGMAPLVLKGLGLGFSHLTGNHVPTEARHLARALGDDQIPVNSVSQRLTDMGDDAMLMDLGPNLQRQAGALASIPGSAQKAVRTALARRGKRAGARVADDVASTIGTSPDIDALKTKILADQAAAADPLYSAIRDLPMPTQAGNFNFVFSTPMGKRALQEGLQMAANDGVQFSANGLTLGMVDYAKRALDDIAKEAARQGKDNVARQAANLARVLRTEADKLVPEYAQARAAFAGPAQVLDAIDAGSKAFTKEASPAQLFSELNAMTMSERDAYLQGARASIEATMGNAVNDVASLRNLFRKGWNEQKLRILLGDDIADDLMKRIDRELGYGNTTNVVASNSETAARQMAQQEVAPELRSTRPDGLVGLVFRAFDMARAAIRAKTQPKANERLASALTSGAGNMDANLLRQIQMASWQKNQRNLLPGAGPATLLTGPNDRTDITVRGGRSY